MQFVVEGKAYWAFTHKPYKLAQENYQLMLAPNEETVAKFEKLGHRVVDIKITHDQTDFRRVRAYGQISENER